MLREAAMPDLDVSLLPNLQIMSTHRDALKRCGQRREQSSVARCGSHRIVYLGRLIS
jgi:hypothetical protein